MVDSVEYIKSPVYVSADETRINCIVKFSNFAEELPYTAANNDIEPQGVAIYNAITAGDAGPIAPYVPPPAPPANNDTPTIL